MVLDEAFVRSAAFREPSARERLVAAAQARAAAEAARLRVGGPAGDYDDDDDDLGLYGGHYRLRRARGTRSWHRTIAWLLAVVMGLGVVALTFSAVYRGAAPDRHTPVPRPSTGRTGVTGPPRATPPPTLTAVSPPVAARGAARH